MQATLDQKALGLTSYKVTLGVILECMIDASITQTDNYSLHQLKFFFFTKFWLGSPAPHLYVKLLTTLFDEG